MSLSVREVKSPLLNGHVLALIASAVVAFASFTLTEHVWTTSLHEAFGTTTEELESMAASGSLKNQLGFAAVAGLGLLMIVLPGGTPLRPWGLMATLLAANLLWCAASFAWSADHSLTLRRVGVLALCVAGATGVARRLSPRDLCWLSMWCLGGWVALGLLAELSLGTFRPWSDAYRFSGTMHPNAQGGNCAGLCLCAWLLCRDARIEWKRIALGVLFGMAIVLLVLTKSRTSCLGLAGAISLIEIPRISARTRLVTGVVGVWSAAAALLALLTLQFEIADQLAGIVLLGRNEHLSNLNGRTELWELLLGYAAKHPLTGYGYRSFWTPSMINDVSDELYWGISSSHSVYLEALLGVGLIGLALFLWSVGAATIRSFSLWMRTSEIGFAFAAGLFFYGAIDGVMESGFFAPSFLTWIAGCCLVRLSLFREVVAERSPSIEVRSDGRATCFGEVASQRLAWSASTGSDRQ
jgi:exopolysaccharide production protein ExoQ